MSLKRFFVGITLPVVMAVLLDTGCVSDGDPEPVDCTMSTLNVVVSAFADASTCLASDGTVTVMASGGTAPYMYSIDDGVFQSSSSFSNLAPGGHTVVVKDKNDCMRSVTKTLLAPGVPTATFSTTDNANCLEPYDGTIVVESVSGGTGPYQFKLDNGSFGSSMEFNALKDGVHTITILDNSGCEIPLPVEVMRASTGVTYVADIKPIFEAKCLISGCHLNNANGQGDWGVYSQAFDKRAAIKTRTQNGSMPLGGSLTAAQKALIACWVDDGAPEN